MDTDGGGVPRCDVGREEHRVWGDIPSNASIMHSAKDVGLRPHRLKTGDEFLSFLLISSMSE